MATSIAEDEKRRTQQGPQVAQASPTGPGGAAEHTKESTPASRGSFVFPEWQKSIEATTNFFAATLKDGLRLTASSLHDHANFLKVVAEVKSPSELLKSYLDLVERSWSRSFSEGSKLLDNLKIQQHQR
ncbi:hypothetical protein [Bradyrhizobium australafricanum]|uniref:hypothetical protein n=1 Tax=Bradyrhizobium australafricanum TaxID=2821406 RepID=UPI0011415041|nr:hypothetical protein [Bradyrhizobium australafricanum]MCA6105292.1 hypothetical protein [Bradyrhizobium australafricanum]